MPIALKRLPDAVRDIAEAMQWYEDQKSGLGYRFLDEVDTSVSSLRETAFRHGIRFKNARRLNLPRFPYSIWYEIQDEVVVVFAVLHHRRNPVAVRQRYQDSVQKS